MTREGNGNKKQLTVKRDTWSAIMEARREVRPNGVKAWETVDEVLRRLLGVDAK